jgi:hypothetical protein
MQKTSQQIKAKSLGNKRKTKSAKHPENCTNQCIKKEIKRHMNASNQPIIRIIIVMWSMNEEAIK